MSQPVIARLAPSPTGSQHLGNARTYLLAWLSARSKNGSVILRIEDIDSPRVKPGADKLIEEDLKWLGLEWDSGPFVQTQRMSYYQEAFELLKASEKVYPCTCSRKDIEEAASAPHLEHQPPLYPGTCSVRKVADAEAITQPYAWRYRADASFSGYHDEHYGWQRPHPSDLGDFVVWKSNCTPAYQLSVVVDDALMGVTEVVRGDDLVPSTYLQMQLYQQWGYSLPSFYHVPLVKGPDGKRLAKRHGDVKLVSLRDAGVTAERIIGFLAWSVGLLEKDEAISARELIPKFSWDRVNKAPFVLTPEMLSLLTADI